MAKAFTRGGEVGPHTGSYPELERGATRGIKVASAITFDKCWVHPLRRRTGLPSVMRLRTLPGKAQASSWANTPLRSWPTRLTRCPDSRCSRIRRVRRPWTHLEGGTPITAEPPAGDVVAERAQDGAQGLGRGIPREQPGRDEDGMSAMARRCRDQWRGATQRGEVESGPSQLQREQAG